MKKDTFIVVMALEGFAALVAMGLMFSDMGAVIYLISLALFAVVLSPFYLRLRKETDEAKKRKIRRNMALVLLIPIVAALILVTIVIIGLMMLYA